MAPAFIDHWPITERPELTWPGGRSLAVYVGLNIETFEEGRPATSVIPPTAGLPLDPANHAWRDYGSRVGVWRTVELLDELGIKASALINSDVCHRRPEIVRAGVERNWCWVAHGISNSSFWSDIELEQERRALSEIFATLAEATGRAPRGWLGPAFTETPDTPRLLAELGARYLLDWCCDDQPFPLDIEPGPMISVPYSPEVNDIPIFIDRCLTGPDFERILLDQFEVMRAQSVRRPGAVMAIGLHPFVIGQPFRHKYLERALRQIVAHDDVWFATTDEIADWYLGHEAHAAATAALADRKAARA
ncbi:polysaccharide deacetylase family protein [Conexibacter stalactiti]|uniref:Polysaccharide deacetylase family protein n=1 Tax=Conexibacter stalactiti TaxID=1940611 RepID=A0ABU4HLH2_9ACTN|nr:polysaccharide deacetylase family protein [Conexibacter stalactiti]MDW5593420.1 polysaccharide deacetylase family protein [Conexibacter stalactiti]MEC5034061.1 polysaccharide deacetylase family protein [Conexibacter stalactiti]